MLSRAAQRQGARANMRRHPATTEPALAISGRERGASRKSGVLAGSMGGNQHPLFIVGFQKARNSKSIPLKVLPSSWRFACLWWAFLSRHACK